MFAADYLSSRRLGLFGFLSESHVGTHGNYGILDQQAVLRWVRDNIANSAVTPAASLSEVNLRVRKTPVRT
jgi:Carboxylesterase family